MTWFEPNSTLHCEHSMSCNLEYPNNVDSGSDLCWNANNFHYNLQTRIHQNDITHINVMTSCELRFFSCDVLMALAECCGTLHKMYVLVVWQIYGILWQNICTLVTVKTFISVRQTFKIFNNLWMVLTFFLSFIYFVIETLTDWKSFLR